MRGLIAEAQARQALMGFALEPGQTRKARFGDYVVTVRGGREAKRALLDLGARIPDDAPPPRPQNVGAGHA